LPTRKKQKAPEGTTTGVVAGGAVGGTLGLLAGIGAPAIGTEEPSHLGTSILIRDVQIFDGIADVLRRGNLLIVGSKIKQISEQPISPLPNSTA